MLNEPNIKSEAISDFKNKYSILKLNIFLISLSVAMLFLMNISPVTTKLQNIIKLLFILMIWFGVFSLLYKIKKLLLLWVILPFILIVVLYLNSEKIDSKKVHAIYLEELASFKGVKYFWGGENIIGIDCSGLPRRSLRNAYLKYGLSSFNGRAVLLYIENWWFDSSALALMNNYRNYVVDKKISGTIKSISYKNLKPGDLAITKSGIHVMVYYGNNKWIQADPEVKSVIIQNGKTDENIWFHKEISIFRWRELN